MSQLEKSMKRNHIARAGTLFLLCAAHMALAGPASEPLSLTITTPGAAIQDSSINLHVTMTNRSAQPMTLYKSNPGCDFTAEVRDANGRVIPLTETGWELSQCKENSTLGRRIRVTLRPGESTEDTYPIDLYYKLARPGRYTVQLKREVPPQSKRLALSNEIVLNLSD